MLFVQHEMLMGHVVRHVTTDAAASSWPVIGRITCDESDDTPDQVRPTA